LQIALRLLSVTKLRSKNSWEKEHSAKVKKIWLIECTQIVENARIAKCRIGRLLELLMRTTVKDKSATVVRMLLYGHIYCASLQAAGHTDADVQDQSEGFVRS
jgi:hypothetical protein